MEADSSPPPLTAEEKTVLAMMAAALLTIIALGAFALVDVAINGPREIVIQPVED